MLVFQQCEIDSDENEKMGNNENEKKTRRQAMSESVDDCDRHFTHKNSKAHIAVTLLQLLSNLLDKVHLQVLSARGPSPCHKAVLSS